MPRPTLPALALCRRLGACALLAAAAHPAAAAPPVTVDAGAGTAVPLSAGAQATLELPWRALAQVELGWMPPPYLDLINAAVVAAGGYTDDDAAIIAGALRNSLVLRLSLGARPLRRRGLELLAGYTLAMLGGGLSASDGIELATGASFEGNADVDVPIHSKLHAFHVGAGWRWDLAHRLRLRAHVAYVQCVASSTGIDLAARRPGGDAAIGRVEQALDHYLAGLYTTYLKAPVASVALAYRF